MIPLLNTPEQQVQPIVAEECLVVPGKARHTENAAPVSSDCLLGQCCTSGFPERHFEKFGPRTGAREALREYLGRRDVLLLLPQRAEYGRIEGRLLVLIEKKRQA